MRQTSINSWREEPYSINNSTPFPFWTNSIIFNLLILWLFWSLKMNELVMSKQLLLTVKKISFIIKLIYGYCRKSGKYRREDTLKITPDSTFKFNNKYIWLGLKSLFCLLSPQIYHVNDLIYQFYIDAAAAAAKLLQSCPTLCDPIDGSPPGSPIPGILQARTRRSYLIHCPCTWLFI